MPHGGGLHLVVLDGYAARRMIRDGDPLRTPSNVQKKNPGRGWGEPKPTRASIGHGGTTRGPAQCTNGQSAGSEPSREEAPTLGEKPVRRARRGASGMGNLCFSMVYAMVLCARALGKSCSHCQESRATHNQAQAKRRPRQTLWERQKARPRAQYKGRSPWVGQ